MLSPRLQLLFDSLQKLLRRNAQAHAQRLLRKARPEDVAAVMRLIDERRQRRVFDLLPDDETRSETLTELDPHLLNDLLAHRPVEEVTPLIAMMSVDDQADVLAALPELFREQLIEALKPDEAEEVEDLLHYQADTAGGIMSPDFFALSEDTTVEQTIRALQSADDIEMAFYIYVVNEHGHLVGVLSLRTLVTNPPRTPLSELMVTDVISASLDTDQEEVARLAARYNLLAIPVVDEANRLEGIVTIDDVIDVIREEATEDILKMAGADETAYQSGSVLRNFRSRAPWLFATWMGGLAASMLIGMFESHLKAQVALAAFIPVVLGMGGNVGTQTSTIMVRGIALGRVSQGVSVRYVTREIVIGLMLGVMYGLLLGLYAYVAYDHGAAAWQLPATVALAIVASMSSAASIGAVIPLVLDRLSIDPAVATGPIVTTTVDVLGILAYFLVAGAFLTGF